MGKQICCRDQMLVWWLQIISLPLTCLGCSWYGANWKELQPWPSSPSCTTAPLASLLSSVGPSLWTGCNIVTPSNNCSYVRTGLIPNKQPWSSTLWVKTWRRRKPNYGYFQRAQGTEACKKFANGINFFCLRNGDKSIEMLPFKKGAFHVSVNSNLPILPIGQ